MYFFSTQFVLFVCLTLGFYYTPPFRRAQIPLLLIASITFYAIDQFMFVPLLLAAAFGTYLLLRAAQRGRAAMCGLGVTFNLALLVFFKYKLLLFGSFVGHMATHSKELQALWALPIPVGISFFVFHSISLLVDYGKPFSKRAHTSFDKIILYIIFFPQLVSGPITRATGFMPQFKPKEWRDVPAVLALRWIVVGSFMKLFIADNIGQITIIMSPGNFEHLGSLDRVLMLFMYSFQIYADFFGYSAIAIGLALLFGYRLPINFNTPYNSASFAEFWRRWHISLSNWLRDYLYFSLPGLRSRWKIFTYWNLFLTMLLGGLWHGAGLNYLVWGGLHGSYVVAERLLLSLPGRRRPLPIFRPFKIAFVFLSVSLAWALFKLPTFTDVWQFMSGLSYRNHLMTLPMSTYLMSAVLAIPVLLQHWASGLTKNAWWPNLEPVLFGAMLYCAIFQAGPRTPFIYFRF